MSDESVTQWIDGVKAGEDEAIRQFVERYYDPLVRLVQGRLPALARRAGDEEDVAISALNSFVGRAQDGQFSRLESRDDLWRILVAISKRKASRHVARERTQKRGGGKVRGESVFGAADASEPGGLDAAASNAPSPDAIVELQECVEQIIRFLEGLDDPVLSRIAIWKSQGMTDAQIAEELDCATKTIERKRKRLREKAERWAAKMM